MHDFKIVNKSDTLNKRGLTDYMDDAGLSELICVSRLSNVSEHYRVRSLFLKYKGLLFCFITSYYNIYKHQDSKMLKRVIQKEINDALKISPSVLVAGARQTGKSTIVQNLDREYIVMDDITQLEAAAYDPQGYIEQIAKPVTIDEIQKTPQLLTSIKLYIDKSNAFTTTIK